MNGGNGAKTFNRKVELLLPKLFFGSIKISLIYLNPFGIMGESSVTAMSMSDLLARLLKLEEKNALLEEKLKTQEQDLKDRKTDIGRLKTTMQMKLEQEVVERKATQHSLDLKIQQEAENRKAGVKAAGNFY